MKLKPWNRHIFTIGCLLLWMMAYGTPSYAYQKPLLTQSRTLIIEGDISFPPFEFVNNVGRPAGFNVDLTQTLMKKLGITNYVIRMKNWKNILSDYDAGKVDLIMGMMYSSKRAEKYNFGPIHGHVRIDVVSRRGSSPISTIQGLKGKKILVEDGSISQEKLDLLGLGHYLIPVENMKQGMQLLSTGHYDVVVCDHEMAVYLISQMGISNLETNDLGLLPNEYCFVGRDKALLDALGHACFELRSDGTYEKLYRSWFTFQNSSELSHVIYLILIILVSSAVVLSVFNVLLRRKVNVAKRQLNIQNQYLTLAMQAGDVIVWGLDVKKQRFFNVRCNYFPPEGTPFEEEIKLVHPDDAADYRKTFGDLCKGLQPEKRQCFRMDRTGRGDWHYIEKEFVQVRNDDGEMQTIIGTHRDITESMLHQAKISEMLKKYSSVFSSTIVGLEYYDAQGVLIDINEMACNILCIGDKAKLLQDRRRLQNHPLFKGFLPSGKLSTPIHKVAEVNFDKFKNTPDDIFNRKGRCFLEFRIVPLLHADGKNDSFIVSYLDVTLIHSMQRQLQESIRKAESAIKASGVVMWELDCRNGKLSSYNDPLAGYHDRHLVSPEQFMKYVHQDDLSMLMPQMDRLLRGYNENMNIDVRLWHEHDKQWHYVTITATPLDVGKDGKVTRYVGFRRDNTNIVQMSEDVRSYTEKMDYILKESGIKVWDYDVHKRELVIRSGINDVFDRMPLEEYLNRLDPNSRDEVKALFERMEKGPVEPFCNQRKLLYSRGCKDVRYVVFNGIPISDTEGNVVSYFGLRRDITDMITVQHKLEKEKEKAQQADKLKSAFLANMSHEIRTPLNAIVGFSNLLDSAEDPIEKAEFVKLINTNSDLLLRLINDILDLSKIESGVIQLEKNEFDMSLCFGETVTSVKNRMTNPKIKFISDNPYQSCIVFSDRNRIAQILTNFLTNAMKYTAEGHVKAGYSYKDGGVYVYVEDTGIGIATDQQHLIFQRFEKLDDFAQGTGLGLSICKAIADTCHGKIGFQSEKGKGSTFWVWIPCEMKKLVERNSLQNIVPEAERQQIRMPHNAIGNNGSDNHTVLIAEDNDSNFLLVKTLLKKYHLVRAMNGQEAIEMVAKQHVDIILMDVKMPVVDGLTATRIIRKTDKKMPIVALTAYAYDDDCRKALDAGCDDFLTKPIRQDLLMKVIERYLDGNAKG